MEYLELTKQNSKMKPSLFAEVATVLAGVMVVGLVYVILHILF